MDSEQQVLLDAIREGKFPVPFGSPIAERMNAECLSLDLKKSTIECRFHAFETDLHGGGVVQGGVISCMLDFAMAMLCLASIKRGDRIATTDLNLQFLRPSNPGTFIAFAQFSKVGKRVMFTNASLLDMNHKKVACATATNMVISRT